MSSEWDEAITALLAKLPALVQQDAHLTVNDARAIQHLADRPRAKRTARCPVCLVPSAVPFQAETGEELFALIANHTMQVHNGGPVDAFNTAESVLPLVGIAYRKDAEARPWLYQPTSADDRP